MAFLSSYRVLDLTDERGLIAGRMLADLGADVVHVEPIGGSTARQRAPWAPDGTSLYYDAFGANRRGMVLDLDTDEGRAQLLQVARQADILIESADPGAMAERGLDWPDLQAVNGALIYVSITAFGRTGPKAHYAASDLVVWAAGGPLDPHRDGDRPPHRISVPQTYLHAGADAADAALLAVLARHRTGRGQHIDISAQASLGMATLAVALASAVDPAAEHPAPNRAAAVPAGAAQRKWACLDGTVEFGLALGPATGGFTGAFMQWMVDEGAADDSVLDIDWRALPAQMAAGQFSDAKLLEIRHTVAVFLASKTKAEVLDAAVARKLLCVPIYDTADIVASTQLADRGFWTELGQGARARRLPGRFARVRTPDGADAGAFALTRPAPYVGEHTDEVMAQWLAEPRPSGADGPRTGTGAGALDGLTVLDLSWVVAGPVIGRALADFGAEVIRVESSTRVETARHMPPYYGGVPGPENSGLYVTWNCGKLGMTVDLQSAEGQQIIRELAARSDVIIESFSPGLLSRWGLDYPALSAGRDDLIMLSTSLMGQTGPAARLAGYGNAGAALSGFQDVAGWPDRPAIGPFGPYSDYIGPRFSLAVLLAALDERRRTGRGCYIDLAQVEAAVYFLSPEMADCALTGTRAKRMGNADREFAPHGVYRCLSEHGADRYVAITVLVAEHWTALAQTMGRADLAQDRQLSSLDGRKARAGELDDAIRAWTGNLLAHDVELMLQSAGVPAHVSASSADFCSDPQLAHRGHLVRIPSDLHGTAVIEGPRYLLSDTPGRVRFTAPTFGRDNAYVLSAILGYSDARIAELADRGVLR